MSLLIRPSASLLDVGCSTGHFLHSLKGKVRTRVGLELSRDEVSFIRRNLDFPVYNVPIERAEIREGPFDVITALQVLEHVEDPIGFLQHIKKHLKKHGTLYLELPNLDDALLTAYKVKEYEDFYYREPHLSYFSKDTLRRALTKAGFEGEITTVQRYTLINHIHWITAHAPQPNFELGMRAGLVKDPKNKSARRLNDFIKEADRTYRSLVGKLGLGESLVFRGRMR
ncbi:class I SAM-dependent methyltransferase [Candidatus Kaiserbacteria bacterium]|nr:class I SAM-dependent methyltransferase [Candidatus Kaiserbacteria bacterium]